MRKVSRNLNRFLICLLAAALLATVFPMSNGEAAAVPSTLTLTIIDASQIKLNWTDNISNEAGFKIDRKSDSGVFTEVGSASANSTSWTDYNLSAGVTYTYRVRSYDSSGNYTVHTDEVSAAVTMIDRPATLTLKVVSSTQIDLTWTYPGSKSFETVIERSLTGTSYGVWTPIATLPAGTGSYSDKNLGTNIQYYYRIKAVYNSNIYSAYCPYDSGISVYTGLDAPTELYGYAASPTQIVLTWVDNSDKTLYFDIERKDPGSDNFTVVGTVYPGIRAWVDSGLTTNNTYVYRVRARSALAIPAYNYSIYTDEISIKCVYLDGPTNLLAVAEGNTDIRLSWNDNSSTETEFEIWRKAGAGASWIKYASVGRNVTGFSDDDISADGQYNYKVRGYMLYNGAYSAFSNEVNVWTVSLLPPSDLQASIISGTTLKLTWEDNSKNETGYTVERKTGIDGAWMEIASLPSNTTEYTDKNVSNEEKYFYRVKSYDNVYYKSYSYSKEIEVSSKALSVPTGISAKAISSNNVLISWNDGNTEEQGFRIERMGGGSSVYEVVAELGQDVTSFLDSDLSPGTGYYYRVRAYNSSVTSSYDKNVYVTTMKRVSFKDISSTYWARKEIENLASRGIFKISSAGYFSPGALMTRGEMAYVIVKAFKLNKTAVGSFKDVNSKHAYYKEIMIADKMGIITRSSNDYFYPNRTITRQDMAVFVARALKAADKPLPEYDPSILDVFADKKSVSSSNMGNVASIFGEAIMQGKMSGGKRVIAPLDGVPRADAAVVLYKVIDR